VPRLLLFILGFIISTTLTFLTVSVVIFFALFYTTPAHSHGWYSQKHDPVTKNACCGGTDCDLLKITKDNLEAVEEGYILHLTREDILKINPQSYIQKIDSLIIWDRIQPSEDGDWHVCLRYYRVEAPENGIICMFAPPDT
jgi:hypothetical protein